MRVERAFNPDSSLGRSRESMATSTSGVFEEEKTGVIKSGTMQGGFTPFKGKGKPMYVVLSERAIEIYENEKAYLKKKPSKYTIDLAIAFNVHNDHYDPKLNKCVCVMRPDDTLLLKAESEQMNQEWYDAILGTAVPARALRLGRFATPQEFFEAAYDVTIVDTPKAKVAQKKGEESPPANIIERHPHLGGSRRLCFYAHTIFLCLKNIEPGKEEDLTTSGIPPFKAIHAFEIQRKFIPNFGYRDNYFILMMGRGSPMGACEMWAECESKQVAEHLHHMLNAIIDREAEKKKRMNNGTPQPAPSMPSVPSLTRGHRERSHTQPHRPRLASEIMARNTNSPLANLARKSSTGTVACTSGSHRTQPTKLGAPSTSGTTASLSGSNTSLPVPGLRHSFAAPSEVKGKLVAHSSVFPIRRQSETIKEEAGTYQPMDPANEARKKEWEQMMRGEMKGCRAVSPSTTRSSADETEDSGGTLRCYGETEDSGGTLRMGVESRPHTPNGSIRNLSLMQQGPRQFVPIKSKADQLSSSEDDADADVISAGTNTSTDISGGESISAGEDYAHMDLVNWNGEGSSLSVPLYKLNTPRSFVSSSDSCYSSLAERQQRGELAPSSVPQDAPLPQFRTYSFGPGHPSYQRPSDSSPSQEANRLSSDGVSSTGMESAMGGEGGTGTLSAKEDARKRAFSLGSKNFFAYCSRPFRKVSSRARQSATSASGVSLASSTVSSGPPPSSASSNHIATLGHPIGESRDEYRNRSGSFGSGRSTPYSRRSGPVDASHDHLMELDFGGVPSSSHHGLGRCGSGSMGSVDSPSRSRTSSFGCNIKRTEEREETENGLTPSQILLQKAKQLSVDESANDGSDYVLTEAPSTSTTTSSPRQPTTSTTTTGHVPHHHHHHHHHQQQQQQHHSPDHGTPVAAVLDVMGKSHDARSSQYFETIEETTSGRSSRASSIDDGGSTSLAAVSSSQHAAAAHEEEDEYAEMDLSCSQTQRMAAEEEKPLLHTPPAAPHQLSPNDSRHGSRSRSTSPSVSSTRRRVDSSSTLQSMASSSDRSDRENKEIAAAEQKLYQLQAQQPPRQKISTQSDCASMAAPLMGLPKRSSVPVLKDQTRDEAVGDASTAALNYAYLQPCNGSSSPHSPHSPHDSSRTRSKSGILFPVKETTAAAQVAAPSSAGIEYAIFQPPP